MALIVFLLAYLIRRRLDNANHLSSDALWRLWFKWGSRSRPGKEEAAGPALILLLLPVVIAAVIEFELSTLGVWGLLYPLQLVVLVLMMGTPGWRSLMTDYSEAWSRGDMQAAWHHVRDQLPARERGDALSPEAMHLSLSRALMLAVFNRFFLVAFWFVIGGMAGAILARGLVALEEQWPQAPARPAFARMARWLAWLPSRLLCLTFGLAGDLAGWLRVARRVLSHPGLTTGDALMASANGALTGYALDPDRFRTLHADDWLEFGGRSAEAIRDLLNRSMLVWLCGLALMVISGVI
ncbi:hypothetical protein MSNKSG1_04166 [Marinobacter santoriniensis NKSG1]|uniref:Signaling modulator of AmpD, AmpE n=1 Tax=Marinobacter santoriniensis NKSG1 TaxID=1288826 RepID=M7D702_9GAMM|nr:regulatory signaling modulator protein AmpE [Marinobacter santoriniensis]EMP56498.1 hypothetical protein MSNKSG1_04166 [Marinobacter santoriniensis NKSG1]